jgi:hypothetical protein
MTGVSYAEMKRVVSELEGIEREVVEAIEQEGDDLQLEDLLMMNDYDDEALDEEE